MLPKMMTIIPAIMNLVPAKRILDGVSPAAIANSSYPILIAGEALPHKVQQKIAVRITIGSFVHIGFLYEYESAFEFLLVSETFTVDEVDFIEVSLPDFIVVLLFLFIIVIFHEL
jgi:hypothetical protein